MSLEDWSCKRKVRYKARIQARNAARKLRKSTGSVTPNIYRCEYCQNWHVGNDRRIVSLLDEFSGSQRLRVEKAMGKLLDVFGQVD